MINEFIFEAEIVQSDSLSSEKPKIHLKGMGNDHKYDFEIIEKISELGMELLNNQTQKINFQDPNDPLQSKKYVFLKVRSEKEIGYIKLNPEQFCRQIGMDITQLQSENITSLLEKHIQENEPEKLGNMYFNLMQRMIELGDENLKTQYANKAIQLFEAAINKGDNESKVSLAEVYLSINKFPEAIKLLYEAGENGSKAALKQLQNLGGLSPFIKQGQNFIKISEDIQALAANTLAELYSNILFEIPNELNNIFNKPDISFLLETKENESIKIENMENRIKEYINENKLNEGNSFFKIDVELAKIFGKEENSRLIKDIKKRLTNYLENKKQEKALEWFKIAAIKGHGKAKKIVEVNEIINNPNNTNKDLYDLGVKYLKENLVEEAWKLFHKAGEKGNIYARYLILTYCCPYLLAYPPILSHKQIEVVSDRFDLNEILDRDFNDISMLFNMGKGRLGNDDLRAETYFELGAQILLDFEEELNSSPAEEAAYMQEATGSYTAEENALYDEKCSQLFYYAGLMNLKGKERKSMKKKQSNF